MVCHGALAPRELMLVQTFAQGFFGLTMSHSMTSTMLCAVDLTRMAVLDIQSVIGEPRVNACMHASKSYLQL